MTNEQAEAWGRRSALLVVLRHAKDTDNQLALQLITKHYSLGRC